VWGADGRGDPPGRIVTRTGVAFPSLSDVVGTVHPPSGGVPDQTGSMQPLGFSGVLSSYSRTALQ